MATADDVVLARAAARYDRARRRERAMKRLGDERQAELLEQLEARGENQVRVAGWQVTRAQTCVPAWDADGLRAALKPAARTQLFSAAVDLNALAPETRRRLEGMLTPRERRDATRWSLDKAVAEAMAAAGKLAQDLVDRFRTFTRGTAYVRVTRQA